MWLRDAETVAEDAQEQARKHRRRWGDLLCGRMQGQTPPAHLSSWHAPGLGFNKEIHEEFHLMKCMGGDLVSIINDLFNENNALWKNNMSTTSGREMLDCNTERILGETPRDYSKHEVHSEISCWSKGDETGSVQNDVRCHWCGLCHKNKTFKIQ